MLKNIKKQTRKELKQFYKTLAILSPDIGQPDKQITHNDFAKLYAQTLRDTIAQCQEELDNGKVRSCK